MPNNLVEPAAVSGGAIGILARQFRGGLVGVISGGCLGIAVMFGIMIYAIL
jgi:hypothetical protein